MTDRLFTIPIRPGVAAEIRLPVPMTDKDWAQMVKVLRKMKPGIVKAAGDD